MLKQLKLTNVGPAQAMELELGQRLNLITGDNGLGKSFLLDIAWWMITSAWPAEVNPAMVTGKKALPRNTFERGHLERSLVGEEALQSSTFVSNEQTWLPLQNPKQGLAFYAMADGSFAVWDAARNRSSRLSSSSTRPPAYVFSPKQIWDGLQRDDGTWLCNGLIRDWASWQKEKGIAFTNLCAVLKALSPSAEEQFKPGELTRISLDDARDMPTITMPYGTDVPVLHASSGIRRILSLAYFLVWCWDEHLKAKKLIGETPDNQILFLIDEVESHLHPRWQRSVIPSLLKVMNNLDQQASVQLLAVTHSPLVMASVEPTFNSDTDAWFDLDLEQSDVVLRQRPFIRQGDVSSWLTSQAFDLTSARSLEAEQVLEQAARVLSEEVIDAELAQSLDKKLRNLLGDTDSFWIRWRYVGEKQGWLS